MKNLIGRVFKPGWSLDVMALVGAASVVYGVSFIYPPAAYIVGGLAVSAISILRARRWVS